MDDCYDHIQKLSVRFEFIQEISSRETTTMRSSKQNASADTQHKPLLAILPLKGKQKKRSKKVKGPTVQLSSAKSSREIYDFINLNN